MPKIKKKPDEYGVPTWFTYGTLGIFLMFIGLFVAITVTSLKQSITDKKTIAKVGARLFQLDTHTSRFILRNGIPVLDRSVGEEDPFTLLHFNWVEFYWKIAANINQGTPQEIIKTQVPLLALSRVKPSLMNYPRPINYPPLVKEPPTQPLRQLPTGERKISSSTKPSILVYHTHTSESYLPVSGKDHLFNEKGDIVKVGEYLQKILEEKYGIKTIHCDQIHDQYPFRESYQRSQQTLHKYLKEYPSLKILLDVHRDATPGLKPTCNIKGVEVATVMMVVGSDKMGLAHPNWKRNYEFATKINNCLNQYYPGLSNGIIISDARYNQHLSDRAIIIEFGNQNSKLEQVYRSVEQFAEILAIVIQQELSSAPTTATN
jgi:stage II sporulation protein P